MGRAAGWVSNFKIQWKYAMLMTSELSKHLISYPYMIIFPVVFWYIADGIWYPSNLIVLVSVKLNTKTVKILCLNILIRIRYCRLGAPTTGLLCLSMALFMLVENMRILLLDLSGMKKLRNPLRLTLNTRNWSLLFIDIWSLLSFHTLDNICFSVVFSALRGLLLYV